MNKPLVAFFSASGVTARVADALADALSADRYEIRPAVPYTKKDLDWMDRHSRSTVEMNDRTIRPGIVTGDLNLAPYDTVYLGFPIWWYVAPTVINTFLESYDFTGKRIVLFATAGSSDFGKTAEELRPSAPGVEIVETQVLTGKVTDEKIREYISHIA